MIAILDRNLNVTDRFMPETMQLNLEERKSTATITTDMSTPDLAVGTWLRDETDPGSGIIWRVKGSTKQYDRQTKTFQLEHVIQTLKDSLIFGEVTTAQIAGGRASICTAEQAIRKALSYQSIWTLGGIEVSASNPYSFNGDTVLAALETITASLSGAYWEYDLTRFPFRLYIRRETDSVDCEMRTDRNIQSMRMTIDASRMYTRFYPIGQNNRHIQGDFVSRNEEIYGVISKVETDNSKKTAEELMEWAEERILSHCEPSVTVQISGLDLSDATGEPLDKLTLNRQCRVPLPEYNTVIIEKITKLSWSNKIAEPEKVTVTLANIPEDVASIINSQSAKSGKSSRANAKKEEEDHAWFEDTTDHVSMIAEAVAGEGADKDWSRVSSIVVDGEGIHQQVIKTKADVVQAFSRIEMNEESIRLESVQRKNDKDVLIGRITVEADRITQEVTDRRNSDVTLDGRITVEAGKITQIVSAVGKDGKVTAASICLAINNGGSTATINADKIYLLGQTIANTITADYIDSKVQTIANVQVKRLTLTNNGYITLPTGDGNVSITGASAVDFIKNLRIQLSGNTYTLQKVTLGDANWQTVGSFSRATSLSGAWSGNEPKTLTVSASPQGTNWYQYFTTGAKQNADGTAYESGNIWYVPVKAYGTGTPPSYTQIMRVECDASGIYTAGYNAGIAAGSSKLNLDWRYGKLTITPDNNGKSMPQTMELSATSSWLQNVCTIQIDVTDGAGNTESTGFTTQVTYSAPGVISDLGIYDINNNEWSGEQSLTAAKEFWPQYKDNGTWVVGPKLTLTPGGYDHSASITKVPVVYKSSMGIEQDYGKLYYYDAATSSYKEAASSSKYWYYSDTKIAGTTTVHW